MLRSFSVLTSLLAALALAAPAPADAAAGGGGDDDDPVVVVVGDVLVPRGETVGGVVLASGDARILGDVDGNAIVFSGDLLLAGRVDGDVFVADGATRILPSAEVTGDVEYGSERPTIALDARVHGDIAEQDFPDLGGALPLIAGFVFWLGITVSAFVLGALLLLIAPRAADALEARSRERIGPLIAIGIAIFIVLPIVAVLAVVTVFGLPLAIAIGLALLPLWAVAYVVSAYALGRRILGPPRHRMLSFLAGLAVLRVIEIVPRLGWLAGLAAVIFGLGLIGAAIGAAREPAAPRPARSPGS